MHATPHRYTVLRAIRRNLRTHLAVFNISLPVDTVPSVVAHLAECFHGRDALVAVSTLGQVDAVVTALAQHDAFENVLVVVATSRTHSDREARVGLLKWLLAQDSRPSECEGARAPAIVLVGTYGIVSEGTNKPDLHVAISVDGHSGFNLSQTCDRVNRDQTLDGATFSAFICDASVVGLDSGAQERLSTTDASNPMPPFLLTTSVIAFNRECLQGCLRKAYDANLSSTGRAEAKTCCELFTVDPLVVACDHCQGAGLARLRAKNLADINKQRATSDRSTVVDFMTADACPLCGDGSRSCMEESLLGRVDSACSAIMRRVIGNSSLVRCLSCLTTSHVADKCPFRNTVPKDVVCYRCCLPFCASGREGSGGWDCSAADGGRSVVHQVLGLMDATEQGHEILFRLGAPGTAPDLFSWFFLPNDTTNQPNLVAVLAAALAHGTLASFTPATQPFDQAAAIRGRSVGSSVDKTIHSALLGTSLDVTTFAPIHLDNEHHEYRVQLDGSEAAAVLARSSVTSAVSAVFPFDVDKVRHNPTP
jgi:hypothetical protein